MRRRFDPLVFVLLFLWFIPPTQADSSPTTAIGTVAPLRPNDRISERGAVAVWVCYNWSCAKIRRIDLRPSDLADVRRRMDLCAEDDLFNRLQRLRIGVWRMEVLAQQQIPVLANDLAVNDGDSDLEGRTDCIDNASNTTAFLSIFADLGAIPGWLVGETRVRDRFTKDVHWTATVTDRATGRSRAVDSWFRPHGHLPFVLPLADWKAGRRPREPPWDRFNPYPRSIEELCRRDPGSR